MKRMLLILCVLALLLSGCASAAADSDTLPIATCSQIRKAMYVKMHGSGMDYSRYVDKDPRYVCGMRYYGTHKGYAVLLIPGCACVVSSIRIGSEVFEYGNDFTLRAFRKGLFYSLEDLYESGEISDTDIAKISNIHRNFD